jgi:hypothetical protein
LASTRQTASLSNLHLPRSGNDSQEDAAVAEALAQELARLDYGQTHDEPQWIDVQLHACRLLNAAGKGVFVTSQQMFANSNLVEYASADGYKVVIVPTTLAA